MKRLWLIQAAVNALLFWCAFAWLGLRDAKTAQLIQTVLFGLLILIPWLWLQDGTLVYCGDRSQGLGAAFRRALGTLAAFGVVFLIFAALFWALGRLESSFAEAGQKTASWLTLHLRKPIKPQTWASIFTAVLWALRCIILPVLMLPVAAGAARNGFAGLKPNSRRVFWLQYLIALLLGIWLPTLLMHWIPQLSGTTAQVLSFAARFALAYILMITAWLAIAFFAASTRAESKTA